MSTTTLEPAPAPVVPDTDGPGGDDPMDRVRHHTDDGWTVPGQPYTTMCGVRRTARENPPDPCCPMCHAELERLGGRCSE